MNLLIYCGVLLPLIEEVVLTGGVLLPLVEEADLTDFCQMSIICGRHGNLMHILGSLGRYLCNTGYTGSCCETNIDECTSMLCQHGVCYDGINNFTCSCINGYTGSRCETNIDECTSIPCQLGVCYDGIDNFTCSCLNGYTGSRCETNIDECTSTPCPHGVCLDGINNFTCSCINGYTGSRCETNINECASNPCQYGTCTDGVDGYTGSRCETNIDECTSTPCPHGVCLDGINNFTCSCINGYTGSRCETNINECASNPCQYGTCTDGVDGYTCSCKAGFNCVYCGSEINECASSPCQNGATCVDVFNGYICQCFEGDSEKNCEIAKTSRPYVAPVISAPLIVKVKYYTDARLVCNITGYPKPSVKWEYSKKKTIPGAKTSGGILLIPNITSEAAGLYTCIATNDIGSSQANIMLEATFDTPTFVSSPQSYSGNAGAPHNFTCTATGHPVPKITWTFSSFSHHINKLPQHKIHSKGDIIELINIEESGILTCTATNEFGIATAKAHVIVHHRKVGNTSTWPVKLQTTPQILYVIKRKK